jgi:hypothetical protein
VAGSSLESFFGQFCVDPSEPYSFQDKCDGYESSLGIISCRRVRFKPDEQTLQPDSVIKNWNQMVRKYVNNKRLNREEGIVWFNHKNAFHIKQDLGDEIFDSYFKFCVVRNPYDVVVSSYYWMKPDTDFKTYCKSYRIDYFNDDWSRICINGHPICHVYIRYENLKEDTEKVCQILGIQNYNVEEIPYHKSGLRPKIHYREYYDDETKAIVYNLYKDIFDMFGYTF